MVKRISSRKQKKILVIHGPNLHLLGRRQPNVYGKDTLSRINDLLRRRAAREKIDCEIVQSNAESSIVGKITEAKYDFLIINPAAYTHTSVAIRDAILAINKPTIEVHLSNIYKREEFRKTSLVSDVVMGVVTGLGKYSYVLALEAALQILGKNPRKKK